MKLSNCVFVILLVALCLSQVAQAQVIPNAADPGKVIKQIQQAPPLPESHDAPQITGDKEQKPQEAPQGATEVTLQLKNVRFAGNSVYTDEELMKIVQPFIGKTISLQQVFDFAAKITARYQKDGYLLSKAYLPPQEIEGGTVQIQINEGYVAKIRTEGSFNRHGLIDATIAEIKRDRPLKTQHLERALLQLKDLAGLNVRAALELIPGSQDGGVGLALIFEPNADTLHASYNINNEGSRYIGPGQGQASFSADNLFGLYGTTTLSLLAALPQHDELTYFSLQQTLPLNYPGLIFSADMSYSESKPGFTLKISDIESRTFTAAMRLSQHVIRSRSKNLTLEGVLDYKNIDTDAIGIPLYQDRPRVFRATATFDNIDKYYGSNLASITISHGLEILGSRDTGSARLSRAEGVTDFTKYELNLSRLQQVKENFQLYAAAKGQYSNDPLLSPEEFGYGGPDFGRAYDGSEISGDRGMEFSIEARVPNTRQYAGFRGEPYAFYDFGKVWNLDTGGTSDSAASTGLGLRFSYGNNTTGRVSFAVPLTKNPNAPDIDHGLRPNITFSLSRSF